MTIKTREYVQEDLRDIIRIYNEAFKNLHSCWANPMTMEWFNNRFGRALGEKTGTAFIAEYDNEPVGYVLVTTENRPQVGLVTYISGICVLPSFQRQGIGTKLMENATNWATSQGTVLVESDDEIIENPIAVRFFEKLGFEIFHRGAYMSKDLTNPDIFHGANTHEIRELHVEDLDQLLGVRRGSFKEFGPWYHKQDAERFKRGMKNSIGRDDVKVFVASEDGQVVGYIVASIRETNKTNSVIRVIAVLPEYRNRGVGAALMIRSFSYLRGNSVKRVSTVTETAEGFYRKMGFEEDARFVRVRKWIGVRGDMA